MKETSKSNTLPSTNFVKFQKNWLFQDREKGTAHLSQCLGCDRQILVNLTLLNFFD
ncbi:hypothetical protein [Scytonema sp. PRP1]|uniref:hypothetical protein n=1 Tax=Scytonema sp. PRP1 TaxID=3120513 RepID=UPI002FD32619